MSATELAPFSLKRAGVEVLVENASNKHPQYSVVFFRDGKRHRDRFPTLAEARARAQAVLDELIAETFPTKLTRGGIVAQIYFTPTSKGYDAFTLSYYQDGQRRREQFASLEDARNRGLQVLEALSRGQIEAAGMTLRDRDAYTHALRHLEPTGVSLECACKDFAEAFRILGGLSLVQVATDYARRHHGQTTPRTVREVVDEFLAAKRDGRATRLRANGRKVSGRYLYELERKLDGFANRFHLPIGMVTAEEINRFIAGMNVEGRTKNNYIQAINVLFEFAKKQKYLPRDHAVLDDVELAAESDFAIDIFTPVEMEKMLSRAKEELLPVLAIGAFAGLRTAEIERLDWTEVNLEKRFIEIKAKKAKTRARRLAPIPENLVAWLSRYRQSSGAVWPFSAPHLFRLQGEAAKSAGIPWKHNALRHSFISYRLAAIKSVDQAAMEAGNSAQVIFQHYRELVTEEAAASWFAIKPSPDRIGS